MENLTHWKKLANPKYLGSHDLFVTDGKYGKMVLTIKSVNQEEVLGENNRKDMCLVAHFAENVKPMILNRTNCKAITKVSGSPALEKWTGTRITIQVSKVKAFGEVHDALRIQDHAPKNEVRDYTNETAKLKACQSLDELAQVWGELDGDSRTALIAVKDEMKSKLS